MTHNEETPTRKDFGRLLNKLFGVCKEKGLQYGFDGYNNKEIATKLGMSSSQFSNLLRDYMEDKIGNYGNAFTKLLLFHDAKIYRKYKKFLYIYWGTPILFLFISFFMFYKSSKVNLNSGKIEIPKNDGIYISSIPTYGTIVSYHGMATRDHIMLKAVLTANEIRNHKGDFTRDYKLKKIRKVMHDLFDVLSEKREATKSLNFMLPTGKSVVDSIAGKYDVFEKMFQCSAEELLDCRSKKDLPGKSTPFDEGVFESISFYFNDTLTSEEVADEIGSIVVRTREKQKSTAE